MPGERRPRTLVERLLSPIADVRQEEAAGALLLALLMFLILGAYYVLKTAREVFILSGGLWVGIFNVMVIAQSWAFANDLFTPEQGKRLFPLIGVGSSLGA